LIILVTGLLPFESGKTSFVSELIQTLSEVGIEATPFKPIGGHNAWYQYETLLNSIKLKCLVGEDAYKLAKMVNRIDEVDLLSPIDILLAPPDPMKHLESMHYLMDVYRSMFKQAVMLRTTLFLNGKACTKHYLIEDNYDNAIQTLKSDIDALIEVIGDVNNINYDDFMNKILDPSLYNEVDKILRYLISRDKNVIIESFNDAALPIPKAINSDYVIIVSPGRVFLYRGEVYARAASVLEEYRSPLSIKTQTIMPLCRPLAIIPWKPKSKEAIKPSEAANQVAKIILRPR